MGIKNRVNRIFTGNFLFNLRQSIRSFILADFWKVCQESCQFRNTLPLSYDSTYVTVAAQYVFSIFRVSDLSA